MFEQKLAPDWTGLAQIRSDWLRIKNWLINTGLANWQQIGTRLANWHWIATELADWQRIGTGLADWHWIGLDWIRLDWQIGKLLSERIVGPQLAPDLLRIGSGLAQDGHWISMDGHGLTDY